MTARTAPAPLGVLLLWFTEAERAWLAAAMAATGLDAAGVLHGALREARCLTEQDGFGLLKEPEARDG